jgi:hypothetical protein
MNTAHISTSLDDGMPVSCAGSLEQAIQKAVGAATDFARTIWIVRRGACAPLWLDKGLLDFFGRVVDVYPRVFISDTPRWQ